MIFADIANIVPIIKLAELLGFTA